MPTKQSSTYVSNVRFIIYPQPVIMWKITTSRLSPLLVMTMARHNKIKILPEDDKKKKLSPSGLQSKNR